MKKENKNQKENGITLIALIVTIVIMLILAGISIKLAIDDNGVIGNAKEAKDQYEQAQIDEENGINSVSKEMKKYINANKIVKVDGVPIPDGFVYVGGTKDSGLVISDSTLDKEKYKGETTVGTDLVGNQFVWIPVDKIEDYKRFAYTPHEIASGEIDENTNSEKIYYHYINYQSTEETQNQVYYVEKLADDEKSSVKEYKGYYIGRYEAGDKDSTDKNSFREEGSSPSNAVVVKANQTPYNYIKDTDAESLADGFSAKQGYTSVTSKLLSSYAWDTAIQFIQKTNTDYGSSSGEGNYQGTKGNLFSTGQTTAVNNIYDMGGNVGEITTESVIFESTNTSYPYNYRGGFYTSSYEAMSAGCRYGR